MQLIIKVLNLINVNAVELESLHKISEQYSQVITIGNYLL